MHPRLHWYYCPHRERFLARGIQQCRFCDPPSQDQLAQPVSVGGSGISLALRAVFPLLNYYGEPLPSHRHTLPAIEEAAEVKGHAVVWGLEQAESEKS